MNNSIDDIRQEFLNFFKNKKHQIIPSSSLIPENDQTLLFTNSGMNQFKNIFLGTEKPLFKRVVTVQRCMRAGGKHNDLDNVGYTERHLTFFEMLGNFSFGDYFKRDAIQFAWELLTGHNTFNLPKDRIWVTTHICDDESYNIWRKYIGLSDTHIIKIGNKKNNFCDSRNFWQMGNVGPCGTCSEIFYDRGHEFRGTLPGNLDTIGERYIEIWNLVFIQFNRQINGALIELPVLSVDTGMGLERITAVLQNVPSNYLIDVFKNLILSISQVMNISSSMTNKSLYVIADHIRAISFLVKDGVIPSNEGRGYVLRRIIRRAVCHGKRLGINNLFLYKLVTPLITHMQYITNILKDQKDLIEQILLNEEKLFKNTLQIGLDLLERELIRLKNNKILHGETAFRLYTTYGFPLELTKDICYERDIKVDQIKFDQMMLREKKSSKQFNRLCIIPNNILPKNIISTFVGYHNFSSYSKIVGLFQNNNIVNTINVDQESIVILNITPFYGESGGQVGDIGYLKTESAIFKVNNTKKYGQIVMHEGFVSQGMIKIGDQVCAEIDKSRRKKICLNHSATHLLHMALLKILGSHVTQQGSLVNDEYLRFDFFHHESLTEKQINVIEHLINQQIWNNLCITEDTMTVESARNVGIKMLSHKQYHQIVRVLRIGDVSVELCGGTHAKYTGEIGLFIITKEIGIGLGIRRIEAVTHNVALSMMQRKKLLVQNIAQITHSDDSTVLHKIYELKLFCDKLEKKIKYLQNKQELKHSLSLIKDICYINDIPVVIKRIDTVNIQSLFNIIRYLKSHLKSGIIVFIHNKNNDSMYHIVVSVTQDLTKVNRISAVDLVNNIIRSVGGKGGGKSDFAQARINNTLTESDVITEINMLLQQTVV